MSDLWRVHVLRAAAVVGRESERRGGDLKGPRVVVKLRGCGAGFTGAAWLDGAQRMPASNGAGSNEVPAGALPAGSRPLCRARQRPGDQAGIPGLCSAPPAGPTTPGIPSC